MQGAGKVKSGSASARCCSFRRLFHITAITFAACCLTAAMLYWGGYDLSRSVARWTSALHFLYTSNSSDSQKVVLFWTDFFGRRWPQFNTKILFGSCPTPQSSNCRMTLDRGELEESDAVIFHGRDLPPSPYHPSMPRRRWPSQKFVFFLQESPAYMTVNLRLYANYFNWTATHRVDSDVHLSYYSYHMFDNLKAPGDLRNKTGVAVWLVSNCKTAGRREDYVRRLASLVPVDIYGACGTKNCSKTTASSGDREGCRRMLATKYKFYLAFENSICKDYITEKMFGFLARDIVVVVLGGPGYSHYVPKSAYIDVRDFPSGPKALAERLKHLAGSDEEYRKLFAWRRGFKPSYNDLPWACTLCEKLNSGERQDGGGRSFYADIYKWFVTDSHCQSVHLNGKKLYS